MKKSGIFRRISGKAGKCFSQSQRQNILEYISKNLQKILFWDMTYRLSLRNSTFAVDFETYLKNFPTFSDILSEIQKSKTKEEF